jgi:hypothetical protein
MTTKRQRKAAGKKKKASSPVTRRQIPSPDTVVAKLPLESPKGRKYVVIRTTQKDPYD